MRILVEQTTRMGDVLQTSPLIHAIKEQHPDAHITLLVRRMGKIIAQRHPDVDDILIYDEDSLFLDLRSEDSDRLLQAYEAAEAYINTIRDGNFDVAYNVTHSMASAQVLKMAGIPKVVGAHLSDDWQFVLRSSWATYFFTSVFSRDYNDLNLCDISRNFIPNATHTRQLYFDVLDEDRAAIDTLYSEHSIKDDDTVVCFQLGASEENKRWSERRFAELGKLLHTEMNARIFLLGVEEEASLGDTFESHAPGLGIPLYGKTSIPQVAALLERSTLLVTNDTGTMHIAASVDCPITLVSVGHVHYRETGPYGPLHCAIEARRTSLGRSDFVPGAMEERELITADQVYRAAQLVLQSRKTQTIPRLPDNEELKGVDLYMTRFAPDGCLQFYPLLQRTMTEHDFVRIAYRAMWIEHLTGTSNKKAETESLQAMLQHYTAPDPETAQSWAVTLSGQFEQLATIAQRGMKTTEKLLESLMKPKGMAQAKQYVGELMTLDEDSRIAGELHPPCKPLILIARFERDNLEGADPQVLAKTTHEIYGSCNTRARLMTQKLTRIAMLIAYNQA